VTLSPVQLFSAVFAGPLALLLPLGSVVVVLAFLREFGGGGK
jgi:hypothetical protein